MNLIVTLILAVTSLFLVYTTENSFLQTLFFLIFIFLGLSFILNFLKGIYNFLKSEQPEIEAAQGSYPDVEEIYEKNVELLVGKKPHKNSWTERIFEGAEEFVEEIRKIFK